MKFLLVLCAFFVCLLSLSSLAADEQEVGNGGDAVVSEFKNSALIVLRYLDKADTAKVAAIVDSNRLKRAVDAALVVSRDEVRKNGADLDAKNYPKDRLIEVSRPHWLQYGGANGFLQKARLSIHEYLGIAGVDDSQYVVSSGILGLIQSSMATEWQEAVAFYGEQPSRLAEFEPAKRFSVALNEFWDRTDATLMLVSTPGWNVLAGGQFVDYTQTSRLMFSAGAERHFNRRMFARGLLHVARSSSHSSLAGDLAAGIDLIGLSLFGRNVLNVTATAGVFRRPNLVTYYSYSLVPYVGVEGTVPLAKRLALIANYQNSLRAGSQDNRIGLLLSWAVGSR